MIISSYVSVSYEHFIICFSFAMLVSKTITMQSKRVTLVNGNLLAEQFHSKRGSLTDSFVFNVSDASVTPYDVDSPMS